MAQTFLGILFEYYVALVFKSFVSVMSTTKPYYSSLFEKKVYSSTSMIRPT